MRLKERHNFGTGPVDYNDTPKTDEYRQNLKRINQCFLRHWADIEIKDTEFDALEAHIGAEDEKLPIDFTARTLSYLKSQPYGRNSQHPAHHVNVRQSHAKSSAHLRPNTVSVPSLKPLVTIK